MEWQGTAILHVDMDAFFASVEQLDHPEWRGLPVVVGGSPDSRGVIAAASYEARRYGVRSAMPSVRARQLLPPEAVWARGRFDRYREMSGSVFAILREFTPWVEATSIDEAYLDVTPSRLAAPQDPASIAREIQRRVDDLGLSCSVGVATSKSVAKVASDHDKPHGITVVRPGEETAFLAPLPVRDMHGVGSVTAERLQRIGIRTIGDLAALDEGSASHVLGSYGPELVLRARGIDTRPVAEQGPAKSVSREHTFPSDVSEQGEVVDSLRSLAAQVGSRARRKGLAGRTVTVKVRFPDFTTRTAQRTLELATDIESEFGPVAEALLREVWHPGTGIRLLGVGLSGFEQRSEQLGLFDEREVSDKRKALTKGIDAVRARFGEGALRTGTGKALRRGAGGAQEREGEER